MDCADCARSVHGMAVCETGAFIRRRSCGELLANRTRLTVVGGRVAFDATVATIAP